MLTDPFRRGKLSNSDRLTGPVGPQIPADLAAESGAIHHSALLYKCLCKLHRFIEKAFLQGLHKIGQCSTHGRRILF